jgi:hypothetical protein
MAVRYYELLDGMDGENTYILKMDYMYIADLLSSISRIAHCFHFCNLTFACDIYHKLGDLVYQASLLPMFWQAVIAKPMVWTNGV